MKQSQSKIPLFAWFYAVPPFMAYLLSWYYNGQIIPLLVACTLVLLAWGVWVWWPRLRAGLPWPKGFLPIFMPLWFLWFGVTLFWSGVPYSSWFYFWTLGSLPLAFSIWVSMPDVAQERAWKWFWWGAVGSVWVLSGIAFWQYYSWIGQNLSGTGFRPYGPLMDTNSFAAWLNLLFFPIVAAYFIRDGKRSDSFFSGRMDPLSLFYLLTLTLLLLAFFSTYSRGGFLAWVCTLPFLFFGLRKTPKFWGRSILIFGLACISFVLFSVVHHFSFFPHLSPNYIASNINTVSRALMWIATWHIFLSHPWLGTGLGSYFLYYPAYRLPDELASAGTYAHNDYIEYLAEGGLINLGFLLAFAGTLMYALYKLLYKAGKSLLLPDDRRLEALGLVLGVFAITGHALGNFIFYNLPLSVLAGLFLARAWRIYGYHGDTRPLLPRLGINHGVIAQMVLIVGVLVASWNLLADGATYALFSDNGWLNRMIPNNNQRAIFLMMAANWITVARPLATQPHVYLANAYLTLADQDKALGVDRRKVLIKSALQQYEQGLVGIPRQSGVLSSIGDIYLSQGALLGLDKAQAKRQTLLAWRQGLAINPESVNLRNQIAQLADVQAGHVHAGVDFLRAGLKRPLFPYPRSNLQLDIALTQWRAGEHADAERTLLQLLRENPAYTPAVTWLMSIHRQTSRYPKP